MKLSQRESGLLFVLGIITILVGGIYFLLIPKLNAYQMSKVQLEEQLQKQMEAQILLDKAVIIDGQLEKAKKEAEEVAALFLEPLDAEYIDAWLQTIADESGVQIQKNQMSGFRVEVPITYKPKEQVLDYGIAKDFQDSVLGNNEQKQEQQQAEQGEDVEKTKKNDTKVIQLNVQLSLIGSDYQVMTFIHKIQNSGNYVRVEQFGLGQEQKQVELTLYMVQRPADPSKAYKFGKPQGRDRIL